MKSQDQYSTNILILPSAADIRKTHKRAFAVEALCITGIAKKIPWRCDRLPVADAIPLYFISQGDLRLAAELKQ